MQKTVMWLFISVGGIIGGYIPVWLFHAGYFSVWGILASTIGGVVGFYASRYLDDYIG